LSILAPNQDDHVADKLSFLANGSNGFRQTRQTETIRAGRGGWRVRREIIAPATAHFALKRLAALRTSFDSRFGCTGI